ncbi:hypothetical protein IFM89_007026 [Coptis chinensis]|uniref:Helicase ATP-binding domain-containing protein n=1 Tax=Coptis chinensis TaxID=261450 RepID=A0A835MD71_9MAGN|nr:hypothetical protein IFM89_007026 [Coptis chinensis]
MIGLVREPLNLYNSNAIKVLNMRSAQVGYVERDCATVFAPLMDAGLITLEGIVPSTLGVKQRYRLPCQVHIFSRIDAFSIVENTIEGGGLLLIPPEEPMFQLFVSAVAEEKKKAKDFKSIDDIFMLVSANEDKEEEGVRMKGTLVVCPPSVMSTWITQLIEHTRHGSFKVYLYYGGEQTQIVRELQKYDLALTTYSTLAVEQNRESPIKKMEWFRVILDEAHVIKNEGALQSQAVIGLKAKRRWVV